MMDNLEDFIITFLNNIHIRSINFETEEKLEEIIYNQLKPELNAQKVRMYRQPEFHHEHLLKPDIIIGENEIIVELKIFSNFNDVYRLFYQAVKYSKLAKKLTILFVVDPKLLLKGNDIKDLENIEKIKVIQKI